MSPLVPHEAESTSRGGVGASWKPLSTYASMPTITSVARSQMSQVETPTSPLCASASFSQEFVIEASMPSWPSSILHRRDTPTTASPSLSVERSPIPTDSPGSLISDRATETSHSPQSRIFHGSSTTYSPHQSPLTLERAVQVDEFGRMILTINTAFEGKKSPAEGRQVRFKPTPTLLAAPTMLDTSFVGDTPIDTPMSTGSRDTFGNRLQGHEPFDEVCSSPAEEVGNSSIAFDVQPGTPLLLSPTSCAFPESHKEDCNDQNSRSSSSAAAAAAAKVSPVFRFPALCEAVVAQTPQRKSCLLLNDAGPKEPSSSVLASPIVLDMERERMRFMREAPKVYTQDKQFEPWRNSRHGGLPTSTSEGQISRREGKLAQMTGRPRAATNASSTKDWRFGANFSPGTTFPNPHFSVSSTKEHQGHPAYDDDSTASSISVAEASPQNSNASVQSIMERQRIAMENLTKAGFWHNKEAAQCRREEKKYSEDKARLPPIPQEEDLVTKVSQWAWLLSSENERGNDAERIEGGRSRASSPPTDSGMAVAETADANKSWEWLVSEEEFTQDSFESNETSHEGTVQGHVEDNGAAVAKERRDVGLGLHSNAPMLAQYGSHDNPSKFPEAQAQEAAADASIVSTPDLGQRESRTTAAIEALLTQVQSSQEPIREAPKHVGTSYLYQQILNRIDEEAKE
ncbi:hypothetical protein CBS101457_005203 [Exobasidium rhododendri]|nr:hypothetical protein CBS101457_005203 [Exobasidium rhododendri]